MLRVGIALVLLGISGCDQQRAVSREYVEIAGQVVEIVTPTRLAFQSLVVFVGGTHRQPRAIDLIGQMADRLALMGCTSVILSDASGDAGLSERESIVRRTLEALPSHLPPAAVSGGVILIGHSEGGLVCLRAANATKVKACVLLSCPTIPGEKFCLDESRRLLARSELSEASQNRYLEYLRRVYALRKDSEMDRVRIESELKLLQKDYLEPIAELASKMNGEELSRQRKDLSKPRVAEMLKCVPERLVEKLSVPVLAVYGKADGLLDWAENAASLKKALPSVTEIVLDGASHDLAGTNGQLDDRKLLTTFSWILERLTQTKEGP